MKRTFYALLICAAALAAALLVSIVLERGKTPRVAEEFISRAFGGDSEEAQEERRQTLMRIRGQRSQRHIMASLKRYAFLLGALKEIEGETGRREVTNDVTELQILAVFEKTDATVHLFLTQTDDGWSVFDFYIDVPETHEPKAQVKALKRISERLSEQLAKRNPDALYDFLSIEQMVTLPRRAFSRPLYDKVDSRGVFEKLEPLGEPEKIDENHYRYGFRLVYEDGTMILRHRWRFREVSWLCEEVSLELEEEAG